MTKKLDHLTRKTADKFESWSVMWRSDNLLDGKRHYLLGRYCCDGQSPPTEFLGCHRLLFDTRTAAKKFINKKYGYIRERPDLRREPHGLRMPIPVRVNVSIGLVK